MSSITLTQMLEYYFKDGLSFADIIQLYTGGKITLKEGMVSEDDLRAIVEEKQLPSLDKREFIPEEQAKDETLEESEEKKLNPDQLEEIIKGCEKAIYSLEKQAKKNNGGLEEKELIQEYEKIAGCHEQLIQLGRGSIAAAQATKYRARLKELLESESAPDENKIADNLLRLGELCLDANNFKEALSLFRDAKEKYEGELAKIRLADAREKSEYSAKLGVICYLTYAAENKAQNKNDINMHRLDEAERLLRGHIQDDKASKYYKQLKAVMRAKEKCRQ